MSYVGSVGRYAARSQPSPGRVIAGNNAFKPRWGRQYYPQVLRATWRCSAIRVTDCPHTTYPRTWDAAMDEEEKAMYEAEDKRDLAERTRAHAEETRLDAELRRVASETGRETGEKLRKIAESLRQEFEMLRKAAEDSRAFAEQARHSAEQARQSAEQALHARIDALEAAHLAQAAVERLPGAARDGNHAVYQRHQRGEQE